jgi:hypothetical protein
MRVIAKAYGDRPLDREVISVGDKLAYVINLSVSDSAFGESRSGVGFPKDCLFQYDSGLFDSLQGAWAGGDRQGLEAQWARAAPIAFGA